MVAKNETRVIRVVTKVFGTGVAKLNTQFKKLNKTLMATGSGLKNIAIIFAGFAAGFGLRSIIQAADTFQLLKFSQVVRLKLRMLCSTFKVLLDTQERVSNLLQPYITESPSRQKNLACLKKK